MKDYSKLKKLAEAATQGQWNAVDYGSFNGKRSHWYVETKSGENVAFDDSGDPAPNHWDERGEHDMKFIAAANPAAVLTLIAEVEGLRKLPTAWSEVYEQSDELDALRDEKLAWLSERDQLKADNDLQSKEIEAMRKAVEFGADCFRKISSGDGSGHADLAERILRIAGSTISKVHNK